jgi:hypothetical protein
MDGVGETASLTSGHDHPISLSQQADRLPTYQEISDCGSNSMRSTPPTLTLWTVIDGEFAHGDAQQ